MCNYNESSTAAMTNCKFSRNCYQYIPIMTRVMTWYVGLSNSQKSKYNCYTIQDRQRWRRFTSTQSSVEWRTQLIQLVVICMSTGIGKRVLHSQMEWKMFAKPVYFMTQFIYSFRTVTLADLIPLEHVEC